MNCDSVVRIVMFFEMRMSQLGVLVIIHQSGSETKRDPLIA